MQNKILANNQHDMQNKIKQLREMVYPKKRKPVLKTKSYQSLPIRKFTTKTHQIVVTKKKDSYPNTQPQNKQVETHDIMKKTKMQFIQRKNNTNTKSTTWTSRNWMPATNKTQLIRKKYGQPKDQSQNEKQGVKSVKSRFTSLQQKCHMKIDQRDPQSLLRKNSLFLLNFIRTRQKMHFTKTSNDEFPVISSKIRHQEDRPLGRQQRQKNYLQSIRTIKNEQKSEKITNLLQNPIPIYPEPW